MKQHDVLYSVIILWTSVLIGISEAAVRSQLPTTSHPSYTLETSTFTVHFNFLNGQVSGVIDKATGNNVVANGTAVGRYDSLIAGLFVGETGYHRYQGADNVTLTDEQHLIARWEIEGYGSLTTVVNVTSVLGDEGLRFDVMEVSQSREGLLENLYFINIPIKTSQCASVIAGAYNNRSTGFAMVVQPTDALVAIGGLDAATVATPCSCGENTNLDGVSLRAYVNTDSGFFPSNFAGMKQTSKFHGAVLWGGPGGSAALLRAIRENELASALPSPTVDGHWAKTSLEAKDGYFLISLTPGKDLEQAIQLAVAGGFKYIVFIGSPIQSGGHYNASSDWGGLLGVQNATKRIRAAGLKAGLHCLSADIDYNDAYVHPVPDPRLSTNFGNFTLSADVSEDATFFPVLQSTASLPNKYGAVVPREGLDMVIGQEIITYGQAAAKAPYGLSSVIRGARGTRRSAHKKGTPIKHLTQVYNSYLPNPETSLLNEVATNLARLVTEGGFDFLYLDGLEALSATCPGGQSAQNQFHQAVWDALQTVDPTGPQTELIGESSSGYQGNSLDSFRWHLNTRNGQTDWGATAPMAYFDYAKAAGVEEVVCASLSRADLGWWAYLLYSEGYYATLPVQVVYMAIKAVAYSSAPNLELDGVASLQGNGRTTETLTTMKTWHRLNLSQEEPNDVPILQRLQTPDTQFDLLPAHFSPSNSIPVWWLIPSREHAPRVADPSVPETLSWSESLVFNTSSSSPLSNFGIRVRVLPAVADLGTANNIDLLQGNASLPVRSSKCGPTYPTDSALSYIQTGVDEGQFDFVFSADEAMDKVGCFRQQYSESHYPILTTHRAIGVRIHGDGSGALLDFQLADSSGIYFRDYYITMDWTGWKVIKLAVPETRALFTHPGGTFPSPPGPKYSMRAFNWPRVLGLNIYITNCKRETCTFNVSSIEALEETGGSWGENAKLSITTANGGSQALTLPPQLQGYPVGNISMMANYFECSDVTHTSTCRAFDANNWPIELPLDAIVSSSTTREVVHGSDVTLSFLTTAMTRAEVTLIEKSTEMLGPVAEREE